MEFVKSFITDYGFALISAAITAIFGSLVAFIKAFIAKRDEEQVKQDTERVKREVVYTCITGVEQLYKTLKGTEKYQKCLVAAKEMLEVKGITVTEFEIQMLIESCLGELNGVFGDEKNVKEITGDADDPPAADEPAPTPEQIE